MFAEMQNIEVATSSSVYKAIYHKLNIDVYMNTNIYPAALLFSSGSRDIIFKWRTEGEPGVTIISGYTSLCPSTGYYACRESDNDIIVSLKYVGSNGLMPHPAPILQCALCPSTVIANPNSVWVGLKREIVANYMTDFFLARTHGPSVVQCLVPDDTQPENPGI
jgi:hypothetical protein